MNTTISTRILLFTGKGGVGKTTVAAATALRCADAGLRTIAVSTDPAHSLADALDAHLDGAVRRIEGDLWGQQLDATERFEEVWGDVQRYLASLFEWAGAQGIAAEELAVVPGLDEIFALADIREHAESGQWDVVVVDCGPTAETLRLLSLPEVLGWYMDRLFPAARAATSLLRPLVSRVTSIPVAGDEVFGGVRRLFDRLDGVRDLLTDPELASVRLVVNPERVVMAEARRTATYLSLFGYTLDAVIVNRVLPDAVSDPWFKAWREAQEEHLEAIETGFAPTPVLRAELAPDELVGPARLRAFGTALHGDADPAAVFGGAQRPMSVTQRGTATVLAIDLPFADGDDLELGRGEGELLVRVGAHRRAVALPDSLRRRAVGGATMVGNRLEVTFVSAEEQP